MFSIKLTFDKCVHDPGLNKALAPQSLLPWFIQLFHYHPIVSPILNWELKKWFPVIFFLSHLSREIFSPAKKCRKITQELFFLTKIFVSEKSGKSQERDFRSSWALTDTWMEEKASYSLRQTVLESFASLEWFWSFLPMVGLANTDTKLDSFKILFLGK